MASYRKGKEIGKVHKLERTSDIGTWIGIGIVIFFMIAMIAGNG